MNYMFSFYYLLASPAASADTEFIKSLYLAKKQSHMRLPVYQCSILFKEHEGSAACPLVGNRSQVTL